MEGLKDSAQWLRVTLYSIGDGVITTDAAGNVTMLNPVAQALTGWTQESAVGRSLTEVFHIVNQETRAHVDNPALRALKEGVIVGLANHTILIARDGSERNIDDSAAPIKNEKGEVAGSVLVFRDITERYRQEQLIKEGYEYTAAILEAQREPFLVLDGTLSVISANRAFYETFQQRKDNTEGRYLGDLDGGAWDIPPLRDMLRQVLEAEGHSFGDFEVVHEFPEGVGHKVMVLNARGIRAPGNHSELILLAIEDITARRRAEENLRESELRYRRLFQTAKDGILILDARTGGIIDANAFMSAMVGLEPADLLGKQLHEIGLLSDVEASKQAVLELQRSGYLRYEHLPVQNQRGERVEVEVIANVYREDHRLVAQCNIRDITQRIEMQNLVARQAETIAAESRRKDEFLAMLSHELRNPLAPIRSAVHLLKSQQRGGENPLQQQAHGIIERQVVNLTKLVEDLLEVSRVLSGRIRLEAQPIEMNELIAHAVDTARPMIEQRRHELIVHRCERVGGVWVNADATRIEEVLVNLLNNAAKYTPDGGRIEVWCECTGEGSIAQFRIRDTGVGIDRDLLSGGRIFDLFTQAERSLDRAQGGLGIGLSLAHRLVTLHDGTISVSSPPDGAEFGSEFVVRLPLATAPGSNGQPTPPPPTNASDLRVLVVDDNIDLVTMVSSSLRQKGCAVQAAYNGPEGLSLALQWRPDVAVLDIGLPGLDGYQIARRLRADPSTSGIRLIAVTGYGRDVDKALARDSGFDAHLVKPVDFADLERAITVTAGDA